MEIAERLRKEVELTVFDDGEGNTINLTVSIGINSESLDDPTFESALQNADTAMYQAKQEGRNQIAVYKKTERG